MTTLSSTNLREFGASDADYEALARINARAFPEYPWSVEEIRHDESTWDDTKFFRKRLIAEEDGEAVGFAGSNHACCASTRPPGSSVKELSPGG